MRGPESIRSFTVFTHVDGSRDRGRVVRAFVCVCVSVCVCVCVCVFPHDMSKTEAARITKRDTEMFQDESWKLETHLFWVKRSRSRVKNIASVGLALLWVLASSSCIVPARTFRSIYQHLFVQNTDRRWRRRGEVSSTAGQQVLVTSYNRASAAADSVWRWDSSDVRLRVTQGEILPQSSRGHWVPVHFNADPVQRKA